MSERPLSLGLVGCGRLAEAGYLPALAPVPGVVITAVADRDAGRSDRLADRLGATAFPGARELLEGASIDGLLIASPVGAHVDDATAAAEAGVRALVEKPPAPDAAGAAALTRLDPAPWIGFNRRFDPGAVAARAAAPADGAVELDVELRYRRGSWAAHTVHDDALADLGPHLVDWIRWITRAEVVEVTSANLSDDRAVVDVVLSRGGRARLRAAADRVHGERIDLRDAGGRPLASHRIGGPVAAVVGRLRPSGTSPLVATLAAELAAFAAALRGAAHPELATAADGVAAMAVLDAARASAAQHVPVPVALATA